ncbi:MAG: magnesium transporter, partial [Candidatus Latescibacteria bacterium]|nr:magnesium transporter [Candidatus Latescibacterota bacterium]
VLGLARRRVPWLLVCLQGTLLVGVMIDVFQARLDSVAVLECWTGEIVLGACVGVAMLAAILFSAALGLLVPLFFRSIGLDPAVASGLLITTLSDVFSLAIYFAIAIISLHVLF